MFGSRPRLVAAALIALAVGASGCGDDDSDGERAPAGGGAPTTTGTPAGETLQLKADPSGKLRFDKSALQASAGTVTIVMANPASLPHNVAIDGQGVDEHGEVVEQGGTSRVTATLEAGEYAFYCSVPGHREGGMEGTLTVR